MTTESPALILARSIARGVLEATDSKPSDTFPQAIALKLALEAAHKAAGAALEAFPKGATGLTPDSVKSSRAWQEAMEDFNKAHYTLRGFNDWFTKTYSKEYRRWIHDRRAAQSLKP